MNEPNKVECYITIVWKGLPLANTLAYWTNLQVLKKMKPLDLNLQHFIFFVTNEWAQYAGVLHYSRLEWLVSDKPKFI